ncbi:MAG: hypothetical protein AAB444_02875 [Patescibacteria group bacterium]
MRISIFDILGVCFSKEVQRCSQVLWKEYLAHGNKRFYRVWDGKLFRPKSMDEGEVGFPIWSNPLTHDPGDPRWIDSLDAYMSLWPGIYLPGYKEVFWEREAWENDPVPRMEKVAEILDKRYLCGLLVLRLFSPQTMQKVFWQLQRRRIHGLPERCFQPCDFGRAFFWHEHRILVVGAH